MFAIKNRKDLETFEKVASFKNQVDEFRLRDKLGEQNYHQNVKKLHEPLADTIKDTSEKKTFYFNLLLIITKQ